MPLGHFCGLGGYVSISMVLRMGFWGLCKESVYFCVIVAGVVSFWA